MALAPTGAIEGMSDIPAIESAVAFGVDAHVASAFAIDADLRRRLFAAKDDGRAQFVITDVLARELAPLAARDFERYCNICHFWYALAFPYFLRTPIELQVIEVAFRRAAIVRERFIPMAAVVATYQNAMNREFLREFAATDWITTGYR